MARMKGSFSELFPEIAVEWSPNNLVGVDEVRPGSSKKYLWIGKCGHEWEAPPNSRTNKRSKCPYCSRNGSKVLAGFNDLGTKFPDLALEWHSDNNDRGPHEVLPNSGYRAWWLGTCGHEWDAEVVTRTSGGQGCPVCAGKRIEVGYNDLASRFPDLARQWSPNNDRQPEEVSFSSAYRAEWVCEKGHTWEVGVNSRTTYLTGCPTCSLAGVSRSEIELADFVKSLGVDVKTHHRQISPRYEYDVTIPSKKIAIEFNGLYWHSERTKGRTYHADKTRAAEDAGWRLIHVWEDDWSHRRDVVERMLRRKLGVSDEARFNARSLIFRLVSSAESRDFLEKYHIQGSSGGSWRGGLYSGDSLVALMVMKSRGAAEWELARFATSGLVRGGHTRLLRRAIGMLNPDCIVTFSDRAVSDGGLYQRSGFVRDAELPPDYSYVAHGRREHKFNYRKSRFKNDPNLRFEEGLTERQLADLNGIERIYDAGKTRWVLHPDDRVN